ncbi:NF038122 family metalloprotease [bacterium]|jgi:hypothetical protein|nr:NF038122 family metalloprotease [bacterium]MDB4385998.1 NF038122 family metalloprotease [bacterium]
MNRFALGLIVLLVGWVSACHGQMTIRTSNGANSIANQTFQRAANTWGAEFHDNITVFLEFGFVTLDQRTVSSATSGRDSFLYGDFRDAVGNDVSTTDDTRFFNGLAEGSSFSIYTNQTSEAPGANHELSYVDNDGGLNNTTVSLSTANAKALGLRDSHSSTVDGFINFNSLYEWDFDPSDGIESDHLDFFGTALHEIGHALGFSSGVDELDNNGGGQFSDEELPFVSSLDFLRFSNESEAAGADLDWTADERDKYFSIDGGLTNTGGLASAWSKGVNYGDGEQASHWVVGGGLGVMDPTTNFGVQNELSNYDLIALDVIGYDRIFSAVPEPGSMLGWLALAFYLRRYRRVTA